MSCAHAPYSCKQTKHNFVIGKNYQGKNYGFARAAQIHNALATLCKKMDKELLYKYINGQTSEQEEKTIVDWLDADPNNQKELNALWSMPGRTYRKCPLSAPPPFCELPTRRLKWYRQRFIRICTQAAAVLLLVAGSWYASRTVIIEDTAKQYLSVAAPAGQRIDITLQDGTSVCLNSGAKLEYPIRFQYESPCETLRRGHVQRRA